MNGLDGVISEDQWNKLHEMHESVSAKAPALKAWATDNLAELTKADMCPRVDTVGIVGPYAVIHIAIPREKFLEAVRSLKP